MKFQVVESQFGLFYLAKVRLWTGIISSSAFLGLCILILQNQNLAFETNIITWLHQTVPSGPGWILKFAYYAGDAESSAIVVACTIGLLIWKKKFLEALFFSLATGGALVWVDLVFKPFFNRERPPFFSDPTISGAAFPSGHATGNSVMYLFLAVLLSNRYPKYSVFFYTTAILWILLMGIGCLYNGVHWLTDVLGGYGLGLSWLMICLSGLLYTQEKR